MPSAGTGPASSTGSPMTLMMRPSVPTPTGTMIGAPVSATSWPRTRPSVVSMAMVRTVDSPRCCATSSTRRLPPFLVSSELRIAGRWPSNWTSTTAPMTWVTRPIWLAAVAIDCLLRSEFRSRSDCFRTGDDFDEFLGDQGLTGAVVDQRLLADHVAGVAGRIVHRAHLRAIERSIVFQKRAEDLNGEVARQEPRQNLVFFRLILVGDRRPGIGGRRFHGQRDDLLRGRDL